MSFQVWYNNLRVNGLISSLEPQVQSKGDKCSDQNSFTTAKLNVSWIKRAYLGTGFRHQGRIKANQSPRHILSSRAHFPHYMTHKPIWVYHELNMRT